MSMGKIVDSIVAAGFKINRLKMSRFNQNSVGTFYKEHAGKHFFNNLCEFMTSDVAIGLELVSEDAVAKWRSTIGPTNAITAKE